MESALILIKFNFLQILTSSQYFRYLGKSTLPHSSYLSVMSIEFFENLVMTVIFLNLINGGYHDAG